MQRRSTPLDLEEGEEILQRLDQLPVREFSALELRDPGAHAGDDSASPIISWFA